MFDYQDLLKRVDQAGSPQGLPQMPQSMVGVDPSGGINNVQAAMQQGMMPPVPTAIPQMQQAPQQVPQQPTQQATQQPGLLSRIGTGFQNLIQDKEKMQDLQALFNSMSYSPDAGIQQAYVDRQKMRTVSSQANQTIDRLKKLASEGDELAGQAAAMIEANPAMASEIYGKYVASTLKGPGSGEVFGTTVRTYTENGNVVPYVVSNLGNIKKIDLPTGSTVSAGLTKIDQGNQFALLNDQGQIVGVIPKNVAEASGEQKFGALEIENIINDERSAKRTVDVLGNQFDAINTVLNDPDKLEAVKSYVGPVQGRLPAVTQTQALGESIVKNLSAKSFLRAFEQLKGGGQITEREGAAAQAAIDRLGSTTLSDDDYVAAMQEARDELRILLDKAEAKKYAASQALKDMRNGSKQVTERIVE
jgi:hypothetical protein